MGLGVSLFVYLPSFVQHGHSAVVGVSAVGFRVSGFMATGFRVSQGLRV